jgi:hypothetical protein
VDDLKLLSRSKEDVENEISIVKAISKDINMNFGFQKCAKICLKKGRVQKKTYIKSTFEKDIKELDPRKAYKYLGIEESHDIQHKHEKGKLKKEHLSETEISFGHRIKCKE